MMADRRTKVLSFLIFTLVLVKLCDSSPNNDVLTAASSSSRTGVPEELIHCPWACSCSGLTVDCSHRGLTQVPRNLPTDAERVDLQANNLTVLFETDFEEMTNLRILQLMENEIHTIERGAFQDLLALERLRINNNRLRHLPDGLFGNMPNLLRLDLSHNQLEIVGRKTLRGVTTLKNLQLDNNQITCIDELALRGLSNLEILTLNNNNLTSLAKDIFEDMYWLRTLRLSDNNLICDCHLAWLARWLRRYPRLALYTRCFSPHHLKGQNVADLHDQEFKCSGLVERPTGECLSEPQCPHPCRCADGIVDCQEKALTKVPDHLPEGTTELRLEQNQVTEISAKAFFPYKRMSRIDLSKNQITKIAADAFQGLTSLTSLVLYGNKIKDLPAGVFYGLTSLQLLLKDRRLLLVTWGARVKPMNSPPIRASQLLYRTVVLQDYNLKTNRNNSLLRYSLNIYLSQQERQSDLGKGSTLGIKKQSKGPSRHSLYIKENWMKSYGIV